MASLKNGKIKKAVKTYKLFSFVILMFVFVLLFLKGRNGFLKKY